MNIILEKISWIPYKFLMGLPHKKGPIKLDFEKIGINEKFIFYTQEKDSGLSNQLKTFGFREPINSEYYYKFINDKDIVLDIGANLGYFTILSKNAKKIICVEPLKEAIPVLKKNIEENGLKKKCVVINAAVGKKEGKLLLEVKNELNFSRIVDKENKYTYKVDSLPLSKFKKYKPNVLRMDVEGYEYDIMLNNIPKEINKISVEFHTWLLDKKKVIELMNYLDKEGFKIKYLMECLPGRLYPFFNFLKKTNQLGKVTYVKENLKPAEAIKDIYKGRRQMKHLFLER
jgi:FkbM family methyltransferase